MILLIILLRFASILALDVVDVRNLSLVYTLAGEANDMEVKMEHESNFHEISVTWRGKKYVVTMDLGATLEELGHELQKLTAVKEDTLKLIVHSHKMSKLLSPFSFSDEHSRLTLQETSIRQGKPIWMMGAPEEEIDQVLKSARTDMRIAGFDEEEKRMRQRMSNGFIPHISFLKEIISLVALKHLIFQESS
ncbi:hypothetical protein L6452_35822 [Arctium lappa]|uniref:Uncharacterized protein n=1 Tax=Arctium lappa TaxID=4217 RepID=A0ACB8Y880_ARCLA|nr:hypothetical protein L6452_35822 [Arctium lappa]